MRIAGSSGAGNHPNTRVEMSHPSRVSGVGRDKGWTMLFSPKVFQVGTGGDDCVGVGVHAGEVGNDEGVGKPNSCADSSRWRVQFGC